MSISMLSLFTTKSPSISSTIGQAHGGVCASDVAAALSFINLERLEYHYALAKYCNDDLSRKTFWTLLTEKICDDIGKNKWSGNIQIAEALAFVVIYELFYSACCPLCSNTNKRKTGKCEEATKPCKKCRGTGRKPISARDQQEFTHIPKSSWSRTWRDRVNSYIYEIQSSEADISKRLKRQLYYNMR